MSIHRIRTRNIASIRGGQFDSSFQYHSAGTDSVPVTSSWRNLSGGGLPFEHGYRVKESLDDYKAQSGEKYHNQPVYHVRNVPSFVESLQAWSMVAYGDVKDLYIVDHPEPIMFTPSLADIPSAPWAQLCTDLATKLNGGVLTQSLIAVSALEARKTYAMLRNPFNLLKADWRKIAHNFSARSLSKGLSNVWLEGIYGWKASYNDIKGIANTYDAMKRASPTDLQAELEERYSVSQTDTWTGKNYHYIYGSDGTGWPSWARGEQYMQSDQPTRLRVRHVRSTGVRRIYCHQRMEVARRWSRAQRFLNAYGLDGASMLDVLWELTPFSFVIDWFVDPLGLWQLPGSITRLSQMDVNSLGYSEKREGLYEAQAILHSGYPWAGSPWGYHINTTRIPGKSYTRSSQGSYSIYQRVEGIPDWTTLLTSLTGSGLNAIKQTSGAALIVQRATRR